MSRAVVSRREWLLIAGSAVSLRAADAREEQFQSLVHAYESQGFHRTGTAVDKNSADWLAGEVRRAGLEPQLEAFGLSRIDPVTATLTSGERRIEGIPLFDGGFTGPAGVAGSLGGEEIGLEETAVNAADTGALGRARRNGKFRAIVCITRGARPGLCPSNADQFRQPFGPPVLQVSSEEMAWLRGLAQQKAEVRVVVDVKRVQAEAFNVTGRIAGSDAALPPLVVMTPRSGWYTCASERGGGILCWLELMKILQRAKPARDVVFVASSGHELGHLGINAFVDRRAGIVKNSVAWIHLGANIGAAQDPGNTLQASDDEMEKKWAAAMTEAGLSILRRVPRGTVPGGEAEVVHRGGGRYASAIGRNAMFHNPEDRGPQVVDSKAVGRFVIALTALANELANRPL